MTEKGKQPSFLEDVAGGVDKAKRARGNRREKVSEEVSEARETPEAERVPTTGPAGGRRGGVPREGEGEPEGREVRREVTSEGRTEGVHAAVKARENRKKQGSEAKAGKTGRAEPVYVRLSGAMLEAIEKAVEGSPIEFADRSEFIRRAVENELRRRGLVGTYK